MRTEAEKQEQIDRVMARFAELGLSLAEDLHACALVAEDPKDKRDLALAFHRITRSVRQTFALEAKLERDRKLADREDRDTDQREAQRRVERQRERGQLAVKQLIWHEAEGREAYRLESLLDETLDAYVLEEGFADVALNVLIQRLSAELGLSPANAHHMQGVTPEAPFQSSA